MGETESCERRGREGTDLGVHRGDRGLDEQEGQGSIHSD